MRYFIHNPYVPLVIIVVVATLLRVMGHDWSLEYQFHPDESRIIMGAWRAYWGESVMESDYGMLPMRTLATIWRLYGVVDAAFAASPTTGDNMLVAMRIARLFAAGVSVTGIVALYIGCLNRFGFRFAVIAASLLALCPLSVQLSHFITADNFLLTFAVLAVLSLIDLEKNPNIKNSVLSGIWIGCCLSTKLSSLPMIGASFLIAALAQFEWRLTRGYVNKLLKQTIVIGAISTLIFVAVQPEAIRFRSFFLIDRADPYWWQCCKFPQGIHKFEWNVLLSQGMVRPLWAIASLDLPLSTKLANLMWALGPAALTGLIGIWQYRTLNLPGMKAVLLALLLCGFAVFQSNLFFTRYAAIIVPMLLLLSAAGILNILVMKPVMTRWILGFAAVASVVQAICIASVFQQQDSRVAAGEWISAHFQPGTNICLEDDKNVGPIIDIAKFKTHAMPMYKWDTLWRPQFHLPSVEMLVGGVTEFPERPSPDYFESQMDHFKKVCEVFVISNRILDPLPRLDSDHPVRIWYERLQSHDAFGSARKFVNFPRIGALMLDDSWVEYTLRTNDHPALYVIQKRGA